MSEEGSNARPNSCSLVQNACVGDPDQKTPLTKMNNIGNDRDLAETCHYQLKNSKFVYICWKMSLLMEINRWG